MTTRMPTDPVNDPAIAMSLDPESFDFLELVSFLYKAQWEGEFNYTWANFPPVFKSPALLPLETNRTLFKLLLRRHRAQIDAWEITVGPRKAGEIINAHREEATAERNRRCLWAVRFANGNVCCERTEDTARWVGSNESWGCPAVLYRESADRDWKEIEPLGPKTQEK